MSTPNQRLNRVLGHLRQPVTTTTTSHKTTSTNNTASSSPKYRFTSDFSILTPEQRQFYEENGYLVVRNLVPQSDLDRYRQHFIAIAEGKIPKATGTLMMRDVAIAKKKEMGEKAITKLQDWQNDPVLFDYCKHPAVLKYVQSVIGPNVASVHTMLINKPPDVGLGSSRHPPHQDLFYFPFRPSEKIVCSWTAMQVINKENGCLYVKPGSHHSELLPHTYPNDGIVNKAYHGIQGVSDKEIASYSHVDMEPGDTIFFHPQLIHGSGPNLSQHYRKAISCHYASTECFYVPTDATVQENAAKEVEEMAKKQFGVEISFADIWKLKSRLVSGSEGTFIQRPSFAF